MPHVLPREGSDYGHEKDSRAGNIQRAKGKLKYAQGTIARNTHYEQGRARRIIEV
jgi:uncharacterized protein YheU (UPF0270 family)